MERQVTMVGKAPKQYWEHKIEAEEDPENNCLIIKWEALDDEKMWVRMEFVNEGVVTVAEGLIGFEEE